MMNRVGVLFVISAASAMLFAADENASRPSHSAPAVFPPWLSSKWSWDAGLAQTGRSSRTPRKAAYCSCSLRSGEEISHSGLKLSGITSVCPLETNVQVSFFSPKSLGTVMVKTPHCRRGRK